jgi:Ca-activated chloride channel family protein
VLVLITDGANNGGQIHPLTAARLAAQEGVRIYTIGIGANPEASGTPGLLGLNPSLDLDEASLKEIADITHGAYFRAHDGAELDAIGDTLDQLEPVAQQPTQARTAKALYAWPLALALLLSVLLVVAVQWPDNLLQRALRRPRFLQPHPEWRERLKRLRLRKRR